MDKENVSTHSRPKAAGAADRVLQFQAACFNTQPPEGGWAAMTAATLDLPLFQHTAARRRLGV